MPPCPLRRLFSDATTHPTLDAATAYAPHQVWAHPAEEMNYIWVGERVATIKFESILSNVINKKDAPAWGPNAQFRYPMNGTGHIWIKVRARLRARRAPARAPPPFCRLETMRARG